MTKPFRHDKALIREYVDSGYWESRTYADFWRLNARQYPNKEALVDSNVRLTWEESNLLIDRIALGLLELGFKKDDVLALQLFPCADLFLLRIACEKAGVLHFHIPRHFRHKEVEYMVKFMDAVGVVIPYEFRRFNYFDMIREIRPHLPTLKYVLISGDKVPEGAISMREMIEQPVEQRYPSDYLENSKYSAFECAWVQLTSGTTGLPKFVECPLCSRIWRSKVINGLFRINSEDVISVFTPTVGGPATYAYCCAPIAAAKVVISEHFEPEEVLRLIQKEKVTIAGFVPAQVTMLLNLPSFDSYDLSSLRVLMINGALVTTPLRVEAEKRFGCPVIVNYGSIDSSVNITVSMDDPPEVRFFTVGRPRGGDEVKIIDSNLQELPKGEVGEVMVRGPSTSSGYYKDPVATREAWKDGWFMMGDLGKLDERGNLIIVGRRKYMINRGGQKIYPNEIESLLFKNPKVSDVAIVRMPDPIMGEKACAYVVPKPGESFNFDEMISFLKKEGVTTYQLPERIELIDKLPMIADGQKVDIGALEKDIIRKLEAEGAV
jgi:non-ribosomal peptide synthetase component E (peptide arylation enzyme)